MISTRSDSTRRFGLIRMILLPALDR